MRFKSDLDRLDLIAIVEVKETDLGGEIRCDAPDCHKVVVTGQRMGITDDGSGWIGFYCADHLE